MSVLSRGDSYVPRSRCGPSLVSAQDRLQAGVNGALQIEGEEREWF